jgi:hypothetical protein
MGVCASCIRAFLDSNVNWPDKRKKLINSRDELQRSVVHAQAEDYELRSGINRMKRECNDVYRNAKTRSDKQNLIAVRYTDEERITLEGIGNEIDRMQKEQKMKLMNLNMFTKSLSSITTYIVQQDTITKMEETYKTVRKAGLDIQDSELKLESAASTSDRLQQLSDAVNDKMAASSSEFDGTIADLFTRGMPFAEVAPYEQQHMNQEYDVPSISSFAVKGEEASRQEMSITIQDCDK